MSIKPRLLLADLDPSTGRILLDTPVAALLEVELVRSADELVSAVGQAERSVLVLSQELPGVEGTKLLRRVMAMDPGLIVIMTSESGRIGDAVEAMAVGAADYLPKPLSARELDRKLTRALSLSHMRRTLQSAARAPTSATALGELLGRSRSMEAVRYLVSQIAAGGASSVLIEGETGTGKELVARAIHESSARRQGTFLQVNCAALPPALVESEVFGHEKGAFTNAHERRPGIIESAAGGTVLLDEIGDMPLEAQPKLLRLLEQRTFRRVGGLEELRADVRVIAATNVDLAEASTTGRFRPDLLYRINVVRIQLPALRDRLEDLPGLVAHFISRFNASAHRSVSGIANRALAALEEYAWPGNVRELRNAIESAFMLHPEMTELRLEHLPAAVRGEVPAGRARSSLVSSGPVQLTESERRLILDAIRRAKGNQSKAARMLGITRFTLRYRLRKHGIECGDAAALAQ
ncbi:MAG TPA: sigma-54 dependent transcriptional regulator [Anaeromyxobacteraceae bacterium]|jgi:DNA-binding NtrC family response regulator|nr:sigma-54 dependent transcriptional regulator [Anaeromyxobacteraceae bacterium]